MNAITSFVPQQVSTQTSKLYAGTKVKKKVNSVQPIVGSSQAVNIPFIYSTQLRKSVKNDTSYTGRKIINSRNKNISNTLHYNLQDNFRNEHRIENNDNNREQDTARTNGIFTLPSECEILPYVTSKLVKIESDIANVNKNVQLLLAEVRRLNSLCANNVLS